MRRQLALVMTAALCGLVFAACSSGSSSSSGTTSTTAATVTPVTKAGTVDCTKFEAYGTQVTDLVDSQSSATNQTAASELQVITKLDSLTGDAIDLLDGVAPNLVSQWKTQTNESLVKLKDAVAKGATLSEFGTDIQKVDTVQSQDVSKQIGTVVRAKCPGIDSTTTTTTPSG